MEYETVHLRRPFVEANGLDHDDGIDGVTTEKSAVLRRGGQHLGGMPVFASAQMQKDKNQASFQVFCPARSAPMIV